MKKESPSVKIPARIFYCIVLQIVILSFPIEAQEFFKTQQAPSKFMDIPDSAREKIQQAIPENADAIPKKPRKLLVFNLHVHNGTYHNGHASIPYANYAIHLMGKKTGAYETYFSSDTSVFQKEYLNQFDALCFNNTAGILFKDEELRRNLLNFVFSGKGFTGIHAAGATFCQYPVYDQFPEYGLMLGGYESGGHPWGPDEWITIKLDDPDHPVNEAFNGKGFRIRDEVFQFRDPYSRDRLRVLLSIDTTKTDMSRDRHFLPDRIADGDFAMSWLRKYGRGRVFYTSFGHNKQINWNPKILKHYLDGIQFAMGDLEGPAVPSGKLTPAIRAREKMGWKLGMTAYTFKDNTLFETIEKTKELGLPYIGGLNVQQVSKNIPKKFNYKLSGDELDQIKRKLDSAAIRMPTYFIFDIPNDEEKCREIFEFGHKMGINTFISEPPPKALDMIERYCKKYNIRLAIHNHGKRLSPVYWKPENISRLCKGRSPLIGACGDFRHWTMAGIEPLEAVKTLKDRLITVQMHDMNEFSKNAHDVPWGTGQTQLTEIIEYLHRNEIKPVMFGLEYAHNWGKSLPAIKQSIGFFDTLSIELSNQHKAQ